MLTLAQPVGLASMRGAARSCVAGAVRLAQAPISAATAATAAPAAAAAAFHSHAQRHHYQPDWPLRSAQYFREKAAEEQAAAAAAALQAEVNRLDAIRVDHPHPLALAAKEGEAAAQTEGEGAAAEGAAADSDPLRSVLEPAAHFAVFRHRNGQFKVVEDDLVMLDRLSGPGSEIGSTLTLDDVLLLGGRDATLVGRPSVLGARVVATVEEHTHTAKVIVFKKKRRKGYKRKQGHRDMVTIVRINKILLPAGTESLTVGASNVEYAPPVPKLTPEQVLARAKSREQSEKALAHNREVAFAAAREADNPVLAKAIATAKEKRDAARASEVDTDVPSTAAATTAAATAAPLLAAYASMPPAVGQYFQARRVAKMQQAASQNTSRSSLKTAPSMTELFAQQAAVKAQREQERASMPAEVKEWVAARQAASQVPKAPKTIAKTPKTTTRSVAHALPAEVKEWMEAQRAARAQRTAEKAAAGLQAEPQLAPKVKTPEEVEALRAQRRARRAEQAAARPAAVKEYLMRRMGSASVASAAGGKRAFSTYARRFMSTETAAAEPPTTPPTNEAAIKKLLSTELNATALHIEDTSGGCGAFFRVVVVSPAFNGLSLVKQHRLVNQTLKPHIANLHGLTLATFTEEQWAEQLKQKGKQQ